MITLAQLQKAATHFAAAIILESHLGQNHRMIIRALAIVILLTSGLGLVGTYAPFMEAQPELQTLQILLVSYAGILLRIAALAAMTWLGLTALSGFWRSYYYKWMPSALPEHPENSIALTYELAELLQLSDHPTEAFVKSKIGQEILIRAGYHKNDLGFQISPLESLTQQPWPTQTLYDIPQLAQFLAAHDELFMKSLFTHGVSKEHFIGSAQWVTNQVRQGKVEQRRWGKEKLARIPGIGKELAYGSVYYLDQYAIPISKLPDYREVNRQTGVSPIARQIEAILARGREANVLLSSEEGAGKMSVLAEIAHEIHEGHAFPELEHKKMYVLDGPGLIASNASKADLEAKIRITLVEAEKAGNIILVITDLHLVMQSASALGSDLMSLLDPFLTSRSLQVVGTTNPQAYFDLLEQNPKLLQRFDKVDLETSDVNSTIRTLQRAVLPLEHQHGLVFTYPGLVRLADNADRFITSGTMPDKALDALTELATVMHRQQRPLVDEKAVNEFFSATTDIPVGEITQKEQETLMHLEDILHQRVIGQDAAVKAIATSMRRARAGIQNPDRPLGSFLFLGPTGVGKTEVSKSLAAAFFGSEDTMTRFDMSEYKTSDALEKLTGSFQTGKSGTLVRALKQQPYGLLLLDEFEKSTDQVKDLFLQILDEGVFADMQGKQVNARSSLVIATSNAGAPEIWKMFQAGKDPSNFTQELINNIISQGIYKPELLNRFDGVIVFHPLSTEHLQKIASLMLEKLSQRLLEHKGISVAFAPEVIQMVATKGANPQFGARPMNRYIQENIEQIIADSIIAGRLVTGSSLTITADMLTT